MIKQRELVNNLCAMKMNVKSYIVGIGVITAIVFSSCNNGPDAPDELDQWYEDVAAIDAYLASSGTTNVIEDPSGIRMVITSLGTGLPAQGNNGVDVDYVGRRFSDKFLFDQGNIRQNLVPLIDGWEIALSKLPVGSEAKIYIPSLLGYGTAGSGSAIPPNEILEFDIVFNEVVLSNTEIEKFKTDTTAIDQYLATKSITAITDPTGLRYVINTPGAGATATWYDKLKLKYTIKLLTDDANSVITLEREPDEGFFSRPVDYIHGLKIGLQKLSIGSKATFYIPSGYAFGPEGATDANTGASIPANANLIVEVELVDIN